jgi:hypothetical protein
MDPKECLRMASDLIEDGFFELAASHLQNYACWRFRGGFSTKDQDQRYLDLLERLGELADRFSTAG